MLWSAMPTSPPAPLSPPPISTRRYWTLSDFPSPNTPWHRYATISPNLRAKGLLEKLPHSLRYRLAHQGYSICVLFLKLFERIYAPLTAGLLKPFAGDRNLPEDKRCQLDRLYQRLTDDLDALLSAVGLKTAA
jgi:hypothetical protein